MPTPQTCAQAILDILCDRDFREGKDFRFGQIWGEFFHRMDHQASRDNFQQAILWLEEQKYIENRGVSGPGIFLVGPFRVTREGAAAMHSLSL